MSQRKRASSPSRIGRSPSLWAGASALALGAAILAPQAALAANFTASNEAELRAAILAANASADITSTILLTQAITLSDPSLMPAALKRITINTAGFALDNFGYAGTGAVTLDGGGQIDFSTTTPTSFNGFSGSNGVARILTGANITNTNGTGVGANGLLQIDGGRLNTTGLNHSSAGGGGTGVIEIINGGVVDMSTATQSSILANGTTVNTNMTIDGQGSRLTTANSLGMASGIAMVTVRNGAALAIAQDLNIGTATGTTQHQVTITGAGSSLEVGEQIYVARGVLNLLDGAHARSDSLIVARAINQPARLNIAGGAIFDTGVVSMGSLTSGSSTLTLQTGGVLNATGVTVGFSTTNFGNLVIGDVGTATGAGTLNATGVTLRPTTGLLTFNHTTADYVFATPISGAGAINHLAGDTYLTGDSSAFTGATHVNGGTLSIQGKLGAATSTFDVQGAGSIARILSGGVLNAATVASTSDGLLSVDGGQLTTTTLTLAGGDANVLSGGQMSANTTTVNGGGALSVGGLLTTDALNIVGGSANVLTGGVLTASATALSGGGLLAVDGGVLNTGTLSNNGSVSSDNIRVTDGGALNLTGSASTSLGTTIGSTIDLLVSGQSSRLTTASALSFSTGAGALTVEDGGAVDIAGRFNMGSPTGTSQHQVTVTGQGSSLTADGQLYVARGTFDLLDGASASAAFITLGVSANQQATLNIAGGSAFDTAGAVAVGSLNAGATAFLNLHTGGVLNSGAVTVGSATRDGDLVIGGRGAVTAAGILNAPSLFLTGTTGSLTFNHDTADYIFATPISGAGVINHLAGDTHLTGDSSAFTGATHVTGGTLYVNGTLGAAGSALDIQAGGTLAGSGVVGGDVVSNGGAIAPGNSPGTLTIAGNLTLDGASTLNVEFGESDVVGGPLNDLVIVGGNLTLDGAVNVVQTPGGVFDIGLYRIASYGGVLTDNGLAIGAAPNGASVSVQTAVAGQVNLVNSTGMAANFWDGDALLGVGNNAVEGGAGVWTSASNNWTLANGAVNAAYTPGAFAIFAGASGPVTVVGGVDVGGLQFAADGYRLGGDQITLDGASALVRVGDGTAAGQGYVATLDNVLSGAAQLVKSDLGTLVLNGNNTYAGGTRVSGGTLLVNGDQSGQTAANLIDASGTLGGIGRLGGDITINGVLAPGLATSPGTLTLDGDVVLGSTATLRYRLGQAGVAGGALNDLLVVNGDLTLDGTLNVSETAGGAFGLGVYRLIDYTGALTNNGLTLGAIPGGAPVNIQTAILGQVNLVNSGGLAVNFWDGDGLGSAGNGAIDGGSGVWTASADNWTTTTGAMNSAYGAGDFVVFAGSAGAVNASSANGAILVAGMQFAADGYRLSGDGIGLGAGAAAIRVGDGTALGQAFATSIDNIVGGAGQLVKTDLGTLILSGANTYAGGTRVSGGVLLVNGDQSGQTAANLVDASGTLGGVGRLGGDITVNGVLAPGLATSPGTLTLDGDVVLGSTATLRYRLGQAGVAGGALNDLLVVNGDLTLDGTLTVSETAGGAFGAGVYRLIDYTGALTDNGLDLGAMPAGATSSLQTAINGQVNLVNSAGMSVNFWDGDAALGVGNNVIEGGSGAWTASSANWTIANGAINGAYAPGDFVVFGGTAGTVNASNTAGALSVGGMQFASNGYRLSGDEVALAAGSAPIRVGDGSVAGAAYVATIDSVLGGAGQLVKTDAGTLILSGANTYTGGTRVSGGALLVNGDQSGQTAANLVNASGTLGGIGRLGGDITVNGVLAPGLATSPGVLTLDGDVVLGSTATLRYRLGQAGVAGGALNDMLVVNGDLTLDGTLNVSESAGGVFGAGVYRLIDYTGALTDNGLNLGAMPVGATTTLQTAIGGQVNLVNTGGLAVNFWDGDNGGAFGNGAIDGGSGVWTAATTNWTIANGVANATYAPGDFVVFGGAAGTVNASNAAGVLSVGGMQFATDGYRLSGDQVALDAGAAAIRVGDGSVAGQAYLATIDSVLGGAGQLVKTDAGTLVLTAGNTYAGGTRVSGGTLLVNGDQSAQNAANLVDASGTLGGIGRLGGDITVNGVLAPGLATSPGTLTLDGDVVLGSTATLRYRLGQAGVAGGALNDLLVVNGDLTLDGTLDASQSAGGAFGPGVYRLIDYTGALTDNGLNLGALTTTLDSSVQTAIANQVNLVVNAQVFNFWDGDKGVADDGVITGGEGVWSAAPANWTTADGKANAAYADGVFAIFAGRGGAVTVDAAGQPLVSSGMQFAADGYSLTGDAVTLEAGDAVIRVGDGTTAGAAFTATIASVLSGAGRLDKTDAGALILTGTNTYAGGTKVSGGVLQLGAGGTTGSIIGDVAVDSVLAFNRSDAFGFGGVISGAGLVAQTGSGVVTLTADSAAFTGRSEVWNGTLNVDGVLGGGTEVMAGGRLTGAGAVGGLINHGIVAPGAGVGVLTVTGDYAGAGGVLEMDAQLGGASASDRLVVRGATSGSTAVVVKRLAGGGAPTADGVVLVQVDGASNGVFTLANGDYRLEGEDVLVGGAYGYVLRKDATGGDWRLRSAQGDSGQPLFQAGAPLYEAYPQALRMLNGVSTLRQRIGSRQWAGQAVWGRMEGGHSRLEPVVSSTGANLSADRWKMEFGMDQPFADAVMGGQLTGGLTVHYGEVQAKVASANGDGRIDTRGFGFGAGLTWNGGGGGYADAQVQGSWFDSDLTSSQLGRRAGGVDGVDGDGYAASLEVGKTLAAGSSIRLTPQIQLTYASTSFESFSDSFGAVVSDDKSDSLRARLGLAVDRAWTAGEGEGRLYSLVNVSHEFLGGTRVDVSGAALDARNRRAWMGAAVGGDYAWGQGRYMVYGQAAADTSVSGFGDSYEVTGTAGFRIRF